MAYASRALTPTETYYAQIEKELLEIVLGVERFEGYVYGRKIFIDTDHKSPEVYYECSKAIAENWLRVQKFDLDVS